MRKLARRGEEQDEREYSTLGDTPQWTTLRKYLFSK